MGVPDPAGDPYEWAWPVNRARRNGDDARRGLGEIALQPLSQPRVFGPPHLDDARGRGAQELARVVGGRSGQVEATVLRDGKKVSMKVVVEQR